MSWSVPCDAALRSAPPTTPPSSVYGIVSDSVGLMMVSLPASDARDRTGSDPAAQAGATQSAAMPPVTYTASWSTSAHTTALRPPNQV
jgi:hypothetical protein